MKHIIIGSLLLVSSFNCKSQQKEEVTNSNYQKQELTQDEPVYTLKISAANPYETYVNDMPVEKDYYKGSTNTELPINDYILKSGIQKIKVVLLPDSGKTLVDKDGKDYITVKILKYPHGLASLNPDEAILIKEINLKNEPDGPLVTKEFEILANVPYELTGWSNSVDLTKEN